MRIGIDLGGTSIKAGLVNDQGIIVSESSVKTKNGKDGEGNDRICKGIIDLIEKLLKENNVNIEDIKNIGIGVPGNVNYEKGIVGKCVNLSWKNVPLSEILRNKFNKKVFIDNDANVAAAGEYLFGSMKGNKSGALITLGTGVGGGLVMNEKLYRGINGTALEVGHMVVGENFYDCACGNNGCLETFASATGIIKYAQRLIKEGEKTSILEKVNGDLEKIDAKVVFDSAEEGDKVAIKVIDRFVKYLAIGINNIINVLDIDSIAIGGGVSHGSHLFMDKLINEVAKKKLFKDVPLCNITKATLGNHAGIIGAAMLDIL